jgi:chromosomal replication initiator protein
MSSFDADNGSVTLSANSVVADWVGKYYNDLIAKTLADVHGAAVSLSWEISETEQPVLDFGSEDAAYEPEIVFTPKGNPVSVVSDGALSHFIDIEPVEDSLNPKYTFDKFVVGSSNQFAHAAALAVAAKPGTAYNPLFVYGGVGLGKTHLMHAIGHSIKQNFPFLKVAYITSERFMNELINAIRFNKTPAFRDKYRSIDVLLMDDVQFFAGKERTQEEFFHTFNALHNAQKQIVVSCDTAPSEIPSLEERMHSRFQWGLIADLSPPDLETKVAILRRKAEMDGIKLDDDVAMYIASRVKSNVRELEGSLVRLIAIASLKGIPITRNLARESMKNILESERVAGVTIEKIIRAVSAHYDMSVEEILSKSNARAIAMPRQVAMYLCKRLTQHSFPEIGKAFGGKHHTTVMHSVEKIDAMTREDRDFHKELGELIDSICN